MLRETVFWTKIGRIITRLSERLDITPEVAFELFYESETCRRLHEPETRLYLFGDLFIVDEVVRELQQKQN